jgi:uncharacterized protein (DUF2062 family)
MTRNKRLRRLLPTREKLEANRWLRWMAPWLGDPRLWQWSRRGVALGVALGIFFGLLIPLAQIPLTAAAAIILRANLPVAAASTLVTNPVTFGPVYFAAYKLGSWITGDTSLPPEDPTLAKSSAADKPLLERITALGKPLLTGLAVMAFSIGVLTYFVIDWLWRWWTGRRWRRRGGRAPPRSNNQP